MKLYAANIIAENILNQVDEYGYNNQIINTILGHSKDSLAVEKKDNWIVTKRGRQSMPKTTVGWKFSVKWKDGTVTWKPLKDLKESNPIEISDYVTAQGIQDDPEFPWWVPFTLRKRDSTIAAVNSRIRKSYHKYGIQIPIYV